MMRSPRRKTCRGSIGYETDQTRLCVTLLRGKLAAFDQDNDRVARRKLQVCKCCHYLRSTIGGAAICVLECGICGEDVESGNTATLPVLCMECGKKNRLCCRCGGDIDMINRQKPRPFEEDESTC